MALRTTSGPVLSYDPEGDQSYCAYENATRYDVCQSSGFRSLWAPYGHVGSSNPKTMNASRPYAKELSETSFYWPVDSPLSQVPPLYSLGSLRQNGIDGTGGTEGEKLQQRVAALLKAPSPEFLRIAGDAVAPALAQALDFRDGFGALGLAE